MKRRHFPIIPLSLGILSLSLVFAFSEILPPGQTPLPYGAHALVGANVVVKPGQVIDGGTIVIRDGLIEAVGPDVEPPADARIWPSSNCTIYAGFIEPLLELNLTNSPVDTTMVVPIETVQLAAGLPPFLGTLAPSEADRWQWRNRIARMSPDFRTVEVGAPEQDVMENLRAEGFTVALVAPSQGIIRGTSALLSLARPADRESVIEADVFQHVAFETPRKGQDGYPASLMGVIAAIRQTFFDARHYVLDHADYTERPNERTRPAFDSGLEALRPAANKTMPVMFEPGSALMVDRAARLAQELDLEFCIVSCGEEWRRPDLAGPTEAVFVVPLDFPRLPKLPEEYDWEQISLDQLRAWDWAPGNPALLREQGLIIALTTHGLKDQGAFRKNLRLAIDRGLSEEDALAALTTVPAELCGISEQLGTIEPGKMANLTVVEGGGYFNPESEVREVWIDGRIHRPEPKPTAEKNEKTSEEIRDVRKEQTAHSPQKGSGPIAAPEAILIKHATIWTCGRAGTLSNANLLVVGNRIEAIGEGLEVPRSLGGKTMEIDAFNLHITPGLIDCHSHSMVLGGLNEHAIPSSAMVRIADVVNSETENILRQLAGGVTVVNLLHGSANPIGGQSCVIKLKHGESPEGLLFREAPPGIKFALGENVKQSNRGDKFKKRFPQTRMGVRTLFENRFTAAKQYLVAWEDYRNSGGTPPARDLELEVIGEILEGKRWIHCHSYRQDEILMFLRQMEEFHVKVGTLQHVLEGYKVADEIAVHGAGASSFSDWWSYKFEVYDAIPYNGSLMRQRGVLVSFNSDSSDLARRLNTEAAKAVKYGDTSDIEALRFVTLNPARQLGIDHRVGSLEPGWDADFVIWSGPPLATDAVCLETWIEGKKYFDRETAAQRYASRQKEREELLAKAEAVQQVNGSQSGKETGEGRSFFRRSLEHEFDGVDRHCLDEH